MILNFLSQKFDGDIKNLVQLNEFCPYEHMSDFENFEEQLSSRERFYSYENMKKLKKLSYKDEHVLKVCDGF